MELEQGNTPTSFASRDCRFAPRPSLCPTVERAVPGDRGVDGVIRWLSGQLNRAASGLLERELHLARARRAGWRDVVLAAREFIESRAPGPLAQEERRNRQLSLQAPPVVRRRLELVVKDVDHQRP
jgi:hypothetical protein